VGKQKSWHEQDRFWETVYPILFSPRRLSDAAGEVDRMISLLQIPCGAHVLDLCCGVGRHSLELARRGFKVTAVDRTKLYLDKARERAEAEGLELEFVQEDMRSFSRRCGFDAIVNLYTSFGYFEDMEEDRQVVKNVHSSLRAGGPFLIEMMGKEVLARIFVERGWREEEGVITLEERKVTRNWSWCENRWVAIKGDERREFRISHRLYSAIELSGLLRDCGFSQAEVYGDLEGNPYDHTAKRLVIRATK